MPPKAVIAKSGKSKGAASGVSIQGYCDVLKGTPVLNDLTGKPVKRIEAILCIWSFANLSEEKREEIFKTGCGPNILSLVDRGDVEDKFAIMGAISALAQSDKHGHEVLSNKVISCAANMLMGDHARSKLPAASLLANLALRAEYCGRVADVALVPLASILKENGPGWAQTQQLQVQVATAIKSLIENIVGEVPEIKQARRLALLNNGLVPHLVKLIGYKPRMPNPPSYPAPPPAISPAGKISKGTSKAVGKKGAAGAANFPQGRKDAIATAAAACLRFMASCPGFADHLISTGCLQILVDALLPSNDTQAAYICGMLWEVCSEQEVAKAVIKCGAVPPLLHICSRNLAAAIVKKPPKKKKESLEKKKRDEAPPPPNIPAMAVCNAAGALHHLTFVDEAKSQVAMYDGLAILVACMRVGNPTTYENATGALWNVGLDVNNTAALQACSVPEYLAQPLPETWLMTGEEDSEEEIIVAETEVGNMSPLPSSPVRGAFITQVGIR